jgi:hypothetical protein
MAVRLGMSICGTHEFLPREYEGRLKDDAADYRRGARETNK